MEKQTLTYLPQGTCCKQMDITIENDILTNVNFLKGCDGNLKGIKSLVEGMPCSQIVQKLGGIQCRSKTTSCPDQLTKALREMGY